MRIILQYQYPTTTTRVLQYQFEQQYLDEDTKSNSHLELIEEAAKEAS